MPTYSLSPYAGANLAGREKPVKTFHGGKARGRLLGGNLSVLSALVGTPWLPDFTGAILFLEETNESEYRIDRMLTQLALAGVLDKVAGVVFGQCTHCENPDGGYSNFTVYEVLDRAFAALGVPAFQGAMIGHIAAQVSIPVGVMAEIDADAGTIRLLEPAVS
jgi:muramoyltetrapeptide carboxypeptidase